MNPYLIGIAVSIVLYIAVSAFISRRIKTANDFYVAGRQAPTLLITGSLIASFLGTGAYTGDLAEAFDGGFAPILIICGVLVAGYILGGVLFGRYLRRSEVYTIPEFFGRRFCSRPIHILSTVVAIISMSVYLLSCIQGIATVMEQVTGVDYERCIIIAMCAFSLITILAGSKGVLITDTIMFLFFTVITVVCVIVIAKSSGGWFATIERLAQSEETRGILSWGGSPDYYYGSGVENTIWAVISGVSWLGVTMVGPWQASRYLMAKNEQVVIRSTVGASATVFLVQFLVLISGVFIRSVNPELTASSKAVIWASQNMMPTLLGVLLLTGIIAAGTSSATTFLSLIGTSVTNDILKIKDSKKSILSSRIIILCVSVIITLVAVWNPPQIFWIMQFGTTVVAAAYLPVAIASVWDRRVTKKGAFFGMLTGFCVNFILKIYTLTTGAKLPVYFDPFLAAIVLNIIVLKAVSYFDGNITQAEIRQREKLFEVPENETDIKAMLKTKKFLYVGIASGAIITVSLIVLWVIPYYIGSSK